MAKNNAVLINEKVVDAYLQAGIDPKTGKPTRGDNCRSPKDDIKLQLRLIDEQDAVNRFQWYNTALEISSQELERLLYYRGQLCFFYFDELKKFMVMPYALDGTIDFYGRFNTVHPVPFATGEDDDKKSKLSKSQSELLSDKHLTVLYDIPTEPLKGKPGDYCVLLHDYTKQWSETIIPRQQVQDGLLDIMADCIPFAHTALLNSTGIAGMKVGSRDEASNVAAANNSVTKAARNGKKWVAIEAFQEIQELTGGNVARAEEFMMAMQSLDNFRLSTYGLENGGLFEKKQYQNNAQTMLNGSGQIGRPLQDSLTIRQHACDIINAVWGVGISCEITETASGMDLNMDGFTGNNQDQAGVPGEQPQTLTGGEQL